jgi:hypothetical protein
MQINFRKNKNNKALCFRKNDLKGRYAFIVEYSVHKSGGFEGWRPIFGTLPFLFPNLFDFLR